MGNAQECSRTTFWIELSLFMSFMAFVEGKEPVYFGGC